MIFGQRRAAKAGSPLLVHNYVIYTVAIPFGPLFYLWVAVPIGVLTLALLGVLAWLMTTVRTD